MANDDPIGAAAADFGRHSKGGGGWALGLAVAACIEKGKGQGRRQPHRDHDEVPKVSAQEFARRSGTTADRVLRFLSAWERATEAGIVIDPAKLSPADWQDASRIPEDREWSEFYDASSAGSRPRDSKPEDASKIIEKRGASEVVKKLTSAQRKEVAQEIGKQDPKAAASAVENQKVASEVVKNDKAQVALIRASKPRGGGGGRKPKGGLVGVLEKLLISIGALAFAKAGDDFRRSVMEHDQGSTPWRPKEIEAVRAQAEKGISSGQDVLAVLDAAKGIDEGLAEILGQ